MAPSNRISSSFFDLKAEIVKQTEEFAKHKSAGKGKLLVGGVKRPDKKPTVWARQNKGVAARASRDAQLEEVSKPTLDSARAALERKAKIYDKLKKGKTGGLSESQFDALLVDFDLKPQDEDTFQSDSDDVDESLVVPTAPADSEDPIVEYEDEFGRVRTSRRSEIPRHLLPSNDGSTVLDDEDLIIRNPVNHFPVYEPTAERVAKITEEFSEANNPLNVHYDATQEVRAKGTGFYAFSADEETRQRQMEELKAARTETEATRKETGAVDVLPGEIEGMRDEGAAVAGSRAMEKRKRELEERRRMIAAKRQKLKGNDVLPPPAATADVSSETGGSGPVGPSVASGPATRREDVSTVEAASSAASTTQTDPLAALEAASIKAAGQDTKAETGKPSHIAKGKGKFDPGALESAEAFLAHWTGLPQ